MPNENQEPTDAELWRLTTEGEGLEKAHAFIALSHRAIHNGNDAEAASLQERLADVFLELDMPDDALVAFARATNALVDTEDWDAIEAIKARAIGLEDQAFSADSWRDYYSEYAWACFSRHALIIALDSIERAYSYAVELDSGHFQAFHLWQKGSILAALGRSRQALEILSAALLCARESSSIALTADILAEMALTEIHLLNPQHALDLAMEACTLAEESEHFHGLRQRMGFAFGSALIANGQLEEAAAEFVEVMEHIPLHRRIQTMIRLSECRVSDSAMWEERAFVLARNTNTWDLLNHIEINRAMSLPAPVAIPALLSIIDRAAEYDDDLSRDSARLVLARKYSEEGNFASAKTTLDELTVTSFGDDILKVITMLVLRGDVHIELGEFIEATSVATALTRLEARDEFIGAIAEGYWQLARIELAANGPTPEWERNAHSSIGYLARDRNFNLLAYRTEILRGHSPSSNRRFRTPIDTVEELLEDIQRESAGFSGDPNEPPF